MMRDEEIEEKKRRMKDMEEDYESHTIMSLLLGVPLCLAIDTWALSRPFGPSLLYSIGLAVTGITIVGAITYGVTTPASPRSWRRLIQLARASRFGLMQFIVGGFFYYTIGAGIHDLIVYLASPAAGRSGAVVVTTACTLAAGIALFVFRLRYRLVYGLSEVLVGLTIASYRVTSAGSGEYLQPEFLLALLSAGVYLVVRGMDNVHQAIRNPVAAKEEKTDKTASS